MIALISLSYEFPSGFERSLFERRKILECGWGETYAANAGRAFVGNSDDSALFSIGHFDFASAQSASPKLRFVEGHGKVGILNGHSACTNNAGRGIGYRRSSVCVAGGSSRIYAEGEESRGYDSELHVEELGAKLWASLLRPIGE